MIGEDTLPVEVLNGGVEWEVLLKEAEVFFFFFFFFNITLLRMFYQYCFLLDFYSFVLFQKKKKKKKITLFIRNPCKKSTTLLTPDASIFI